MKRHFFELAELHTLPLNIFLVLLGVAYSQFNYQRGLNVSVIIYLLCICMFHITVNIHNNLKDFQNASHNPYYQKEINVIGRKNLDLKTVKNFYFIFLALSVLAGILLAVGKGLPFWLFGLLAFAIGLLYSGGPRPINSLPIAETLPALASGSGIAFGSAYLVLRGTGLFTTLDYGKIFLITLPTFLCMFCNLLANNTCDLQQDIKNNRRTLVYYIGTKNAVTLLKTVMLVIQLIIFMLVLTGLAPRLVAIELLLFPLIWQMLKRYFEKQVKHETFIEVIKSGSLIMTVYSLLFFIGA